MILSTQSLRRMCNRRGNGRERIRSMPLAQHAGLCILADVLSACALGTSPCLPRHHWRCSAGVRTSGISSGGSNQSFPTPQKLVDSEKEIDDVAVTKTESTGRRPSTGYSRPIRLARRIWNLAAGQTSSMGIAAEGADVFWIDLDFRESSRWLEQRRLRGGHQPSSLPVRGMHSG